MRIISNSYIKGARDVWHFIAPMPKGAKCTRDECAINVIHLSAHDMTIIYPVGIATIDTHRTPEKEKRDKLILLKMVLQSHSALECRL